MSFKVGDKVKCINAVGESGLTLDKIYDIFTDDKTDAWIVNDNLILGGYDGSRFHVVMNSLQYNVPSTSAGIWNIATKKFTTPNFDFSPFGLDYSILEQTKKVKCECGTTKTMGEANDQAQFHSTWCPVKTEFENTKVPWKVPWNSSGRYEES